MNERDKEEIGRLLRSVVHPVTNADLQRDLWPRMLRRMDAGRVRVPWFDWALMGLLALLLFLFPGAIPEVLYHL